MMYPYGPWAYGFGGFGILWTVIWWIFFAFIISFLIRFLFFGGGHRRRWREEMRDMIHDNRSALDILKERYVKGEITKEQFDSMKRDIGEN